MLGDQVVQVQMFDCYWSEKELVSHQFVVISPVCPTTLLRDPLNNLQFPMSKIFSEKRRQFDRWKIVAGEEKYSTWVLPRLRLKTPSIIDKNG
jgi:hypothetical protein